MLNFMKWMHKWMGPDKETPQPELEEEEVESPDTGIATVIGQGNKSKEESDGCDTEINAGGEDVRIVIDQFEVSNRT